MPDGLEDERVAVDTLCLEGPVEAEVGDADGAPGEELGNGGEVLEPLEDDGGTLGDGEVGEEGDGGGDEDGVVWDTTLGTLQEELRSLLVLGDTEEVTGTGVQEGVTGRGSGCQNDGVDDGWEDWDSGTVDGDNPRRGCGTSATSRKTWLVGWNENTDGEGTEAVEEEDTPEDSLDCLGNVLARVLSFTSGDSNHLDTSV